MTTPFNPLVSIIIPVYNGANFLGEAIDSALAQTYKNIEILVVNDGSNDNGATERIAKSYGDRIRYYYKDNGGVSSALNMGIQKSRGEYFCWLSHDDIYYPHKVDTMLGAIFEGGDPTAPAYGNFDILDMNTGLVRHVRIEEYHCRKRLEQGLYPGLFPGMATAVSWCIHVSHFQRVGLFDENLLVAQDCEMAFRILRGQKVVFVDNPTICIRQHDEQGTRTIAPTRLDEIYSVYCKLFSSVTEAEAKAIFGGEYQYCLKMMEIYSHHPDPRPYEMAFQRLRRSPKPPEVITREERLHKRIKELGSGRANDICIFCAGIQGLFLMNALRAMQIKISCFSDNDPEKWGRDYFGIPCVKPMDIRLDDTLVIISINNSSPIMEQLNKMGAKYITTKKAIETWL